MNHFNFNFHFHCHYYFMVNNQNHHHHLLLLNHHYFHPHQKDDLSHYYMIFLHPTDQIPPDHLIHYLQLYSNHCYSMNECQNFDLLQAIQGFIPKI